MDKKTIAKKGAIPATVFAGLLGMLGVSQHDQEIRAKLEKAITADRTIDVLLIEKIAKGDSADSRRTAFQTYLKMEERKADLFRNAEDPDVVIADLLKQREGGWKDEN